MNDIIILEMDWSNNDLEEIILGVIVKDDYTVGQKKAMKRFCMKQRNILCAYCGGSYVKSNYCIITDDSIKSCCQLCHIVTHFTPSVSKMINICKSTKPQLEIIRDTINFIISHKKAPQIIDIDPNAKLMKIKPVKYFNTREEYDNEKVKIFYTPNIDMTNIINGIFDPSQDFPGYNINENITITENEFIQSPKIDRVSLRKLETSMRLFEWFTKVSDVKKFSTELDKIKFEMV